MKTSQIRYRRCRWTHTFNNIFDDPMFMIIENTEELTAVTIKRIEWNDQY